MSDSIEDRLEQLRNSATRYELVIRNDRTGERLRLCYTARKNRHGIADAIRNGGEDLVRVTGSEAFTFGKGPTAKIGDWSVTFSGRTQREAIASGSELHWYKSALREG